MPFLIVRKSKLYLGVERAGGVRIIVYDASDTKSLLTSTSARVGLSTLSWRPPSSQLSLPGHSACWSSCDVAYIKDIDSQNKFCIRFTVCTTFSLSSDSLLLCRNPCIRSTFCPGPCFRNGLYIELRFTQISRWFVRTPGWVESCHSQPCLRRGEWDPCQNHDWWDRWTASGGHPL